MLIDEVHAAGFTSAVALELACRQWRRTQEWIPSSPAQLLKAIRVEEECWNSINYAMRLDPNEGDEENITTYYDDVEQSLAQWKERMSTPGFDWKVFKVEQTVNELLKYAKHLDKLREAEGDDAKYAEQRLYAYINDLQLARMSILNLTPELKHEKVWI